MTFSVYEYTLISFYKPNSILTNKGAFYGNKLIRNPVIMHFLMRIIDFSFFNRSLTNAKRLLTTENGGFLLSTDYWQSFLVVMKRNLVLLAIKLAVLQLL